MNGLCILLVWSAMGLNLMVQGSNNVLGQIAYCFLPDVRSAMIKTAGDSCALRDDKDQIVIRDEWIWAAPASQKMTAAYMVIDPGWWHRRVKARWIPSDGDRSKQGTEGRRQGDHDASVYSRH